MTDLNVIELFFAKNPGLQEIIVQNQSNTWPIRAHFDQDKPKPDLPETFRDYVSDTCQEINVSPEHIYCFRYSKNEKGQLERGIIYSL